RVGEPELAEHQLRRAVVEQHEGEREPHPAVRPPGERHADGAGQLLLFGVLGGDHVPTPPHRGAAADHPPVSTPLRPSTVVVPAHSIACSATHDASVRSGRPVTSSPSATKPSSRPVSSSISSARCRASSAGSSPARSCSSWGSASRSNSCSWPSPENQTYLCRCE